jgi:hypothetical protein
MSRIPFQGQQHQSARAIHYTMNMPSTGCATLPRGPHFFPVRVIHELPSTTLPGAPQRRLLPVGGQRLAVSSAATSSAVSLRFAALVKLSTCMTLVALAIGAVTPSRAMSQASAISAGLA